MSFGNIPALRPRDQQTLRAPPDFERLSRSVDGGISARYQEFMLGDWRRSRVLAPAVAAATGDLLSRSAMSPMPQRPADDRREFLVYRDRIGVASEIQFSLRQYLGFRTLRPVLIGRVMLRVTSSASTMAMKMAAALIPLHQPTTDDRAAARAVVCA